MCESVCGGRGAEPLVTGRMGGGGRGEGRREWGLSANLLTFVIQMNCISWLVLNIFSFK